MGNQAREQAAALQKDIEAILDQLRDVDTKIRVSSPYYAALTQPQPLDASGIQQQLDPETVLLEYARGEKHTFLWAVTADSVRSFELAAPEKIQAAIQHLRQFSVKPDAGFQECAADLAEMLLGPVNGLLGHKRLVIVADGALRYVPFAALTPARRGPPLATHEIVYLPSASTIAMMRSESAGRRMAPKAVAVFADPVFTSDDERLSQTQSQTRTDGVRSAEDGDARRSAAEIDAINPGLQLARLPFTRQEAKEIASIAPKSESVTYLDFDANRNMAMSREIRQYRIVHFATHAFINNLHPELSGIVLSLVNREGHEQDGFLRLHDIYNLSLPVDMVVISACESGLGKEIDGEGFIGFTRGFFYAGAARVLVSLWKVDDEATTEMMQEFYRAIFLKHFRPAAALRAAQNEMRKNERWSSPYYWAGFVMLGEWR